MSVLIITPLAYCVWVKGITLCNCVFFLLLFFCQRYPKYWWIRSKKLFYRPPKSKYNTRFYRFSSGPWNIQLLLGYANIWATVHFNPSGNKARRVCWRKQPTSNNFQILQTVCSYSNCTIDSFIQSLLILEISTKNIQKWKNSKP